MKRDMSPEARELMLYTDNEEDLYRQRKSPIWKNLAGKRARETYDRVLAVKAFMYLADAGAKKYAREMDPGTPWHVIFPLAARREAAREWVEEFETEYSLGNLSYLVPKKYQDAAPAPRHTVRGHGQARSGASSARKRARS